MIGIILLLILVAIVSQGGRNVIGAVLSLIVGLTLLLASCGIG